MKGRRRKMYVNQREKRETLGGFFTSPTIVRITKRKTYLYVDESAAFFFFFFCFQTLGFGVDFDSHHTSCRIS